MMTAMRHLPIATLFLTAIASTAQAQVARFVVSPDTVDAGGSYTVRYAITSGARGFAKGGGVRIEIPVAYAETEFLLWSAPHVDAPTTAGHVSAMTSSGARVNIHVEGLLRGIVQADFIDDVSPGATVAITWRGQVQGIAGQVDARAQFRQRASDPWSAPPGTPRITVRPSRAEYVSVHYPSDLARGAPFVLSVVAFDRYGNVASGYAGTLTLASTDPAAVVPRSVTFRARDRGRVVIPDASFQTTGFQKVTARDPEQRLASTFKYAMVSDTPPTVRHFFGDLHFHSGTGAEGAGFLAVPTGADVNTTGTSTFKALNLAGDHRANFTRAADAYTYARDVMGLDFASTSEHSAPLLTPAAWGRSQDISDSFNVPGAFTTFYGFEWTPDLDHYVVMYKSRDGMPIRHDRHPDYPSLTRALDAQGTPVLTIPHVSWPFSRHPLWEDTTARASRRIGEIYSLWNSRHLVQPDDDPQLFELGADDPWSFQYAWKRGIRIGVSAASDNHLGHPGANNTTISVRHSGGLTGVVATANDRERIWQSLTARATYATTGTQIYVDFEADGHVMGSEYRTNAAPRFTARVAGTNRLATVEIVRLAGGVYTTVHRVAPEGETTAFSWTDSTFTDAAMYYLRVRQVDEYPGRLYSHSTAEMAWSSPIWIGRTER